MLNIKKQIQGEYKMKTTTLLALGLATFTTLTVGAQVTQAVTLEGESTGYINLRDNWEGGGIVDPETGGGGEEIVPPVQPPVVGNKDLALIYYPSFDFGTRDYDGRAATYYAKPFTGTVAGTTVTRPQFVQVRNSSEVAQWNLKVTAEQFISQDGKNTAVPGMLMTLNDINTTTNTENSMSATVANTTLALTPGQAQTIGTYNNASATGISKNSFMFGAPTNVTAANYKGVQIDLPGDLELADTAYVADIVWTLADSL